MSVRSYFKKYERREGCVLFFKKLCSFLGFVVAFFLIVGFIYARIKDEKPPEYLKFVIGVCSFFVASLGWLREKNKWGVIASQYCNMRRLFQKTLDYIAVDNTEHTLESKRQVLKELMIFAHQENAEWNSIKNKAKPEPMW